jgi:cell division septation protein DedD
MDNFNRIKKVEPNAVIMNLNQEMKIQLGIFNTETEAKNQGQKLQNQGIKIYIQPINN